VDSEQLAQTFVELADSLVDDFDALDLLKVLVERSVDLLGVAAAGLLIADGQDQMRLAASSSESARLLELFQIQNDEGPCLNCYWSGQPISADSMTEANSRWPRFAEAASREGFVGVLALPLRLRGRVIGALNLFDANGTLSDPTIHPIAQAMADVATIAILQDRFGRQREVLNEQLQSALTSRVVIEQAKGVLAARLHVDMDEAFERLRKRSRDDRWRLVEVAEEVVSAHSDEVLVSYDHRRRAVERARVANERDRVANERDRVANERDRIASVRNYLGDERDRTVERRAEQMRRGLTDQAVEDVLDRPQSVQEHQEAARRRQRAVDLRNHAATKRRDAADARDRAAAERDHSADERDAGGERDLEADRRDREADRRDRESDQRDREADRRDREADQRDRRADRRDEEADQRERDRDAVLREMDTVESDAGIEVLIERAEQRDLRAEQRDRRAEERDSMAGPEGGDEGDIHADRAAAARDRELGARDRDQAAGDRADLRDAYNRALGRRHGTTKPEENPDQPRALEDAQSEADE
jgi:hypothetical protein